MGVWSGRLRPRGPKRTDAVLMAIHDALCPETLRYIALLHLTRPPRYRTRSYSRRITGDAFKRHDGLSVFTSKRG